MENNWNEKGLAGYPSIDKPWLKYYSEEAINAPLPECTIYEYLWENNKDSLDDVALVYFGRKITFKKLFKNIDIVAKSFVSIGIKQGDIVVIALPNIPENIYCVYALNKIGAIADMVDLRSKGDTLVHYLNASGATSAVICDLFAKNTFEIISKTNIKKLIIASPFDSLYAPLQCVMKMKSKKLNLPSCALKWKHFVKLNNKVQEINAVGKSKDIVCILHTSGTTALPKGVMLSNYSFNAMTIQYRYGGMLFDRCDKFLNQVPPFLAYNLIIATHVPLILHMSVVMLPDYQPEKFAENIMKFKPNHVAAGPADWNNFLENPRTLKSNFAFLKTMGSGSDTMSIQNKQAVNELVRSRGSRLGILEGYGMTEIGSAACTNLPQCDVLGSVGIPLPKNSFCIYDSEKKKELPYNSVGEICMSGPTVMSGYFGNTEETNKVLKKHEDGTIWLHSGDLGYINEDGNVFLEGRLKRIIIRHDGIKVSPFNIEKTILKHSSVTSCCVVGVFDQEHDRGQVPVAFCVLKEIDTNSLKEIQELCERELSENYLPHYYKIIDSLPLTPNGKVDYRALEKEANPKNKEK